MLNGFAVPSSSSWSSPCLLDVKSDGSLRFCIGFHRVNAITVPDAHPLPRIDDCIDEIGPAKYVSKLNILKGYWSWLCNAPATFKRLNKVLGDVSNCKVYLDDIVVYWDDWASHMTTLREVICTYLPHHLRWTLLNLSLEGLFSILVSRLVKDRGVLQMWKPQPLLSLQCHLPERSCTISLGWLVTIAGLAKNVLCGSFTDCFNQFFQALCLVWWVSTVVW